MVRAAVHSTLFFFFSSSAFYRLPQNEDIFAIDDVARATRLEENFFSLYLCFCQTEKETTKFNHQAKKLPISMMLFNRMERRKTMHYLFVLRGHSRAREDFHLAASRCSGGSKISVSARLQLLMREGTDEERKEAYMISSRMVLVEGLSIILRPLCQGKRFFFHHRRGKRREKKMRKTNRRKQPSCI